MHTLNQLLCDQDFINLNEKLCQYNIFKALRIDHYEVRHSKFLAHLLDPNETHGLEAEFLQNFLLLLSNSEEGKEIPVICLDLDMASISTEKELPNGNDRYKLDVLIEIPKKQDPKSIYRIAIECKIRAGVGPTQLQDYSKGLKELYGEDGVAHKVLLTISEERDENVLEPWVNVTYQDTVMEAIATTLLKIEKTSSSRIIDILNDYNDLLAEQTENETCNAELDTLCSHLIRYTDVISPEPNKSNYDYLKTKFRNAVMYLEGFIKRKDDLQSQMQDQFKKKVKDAKYCAGNSNRQYLRFYPAEVYPFVRTDWGNSSRFPWQNTGDTFFYPLLFEVQMRQEEGQDGFLARCGLVLSPLPDNSIGSREMVRDAIRKVVTNKSIAKWGVKKKRGITAKFTLIVSTEWQTISKPNQIERVLEDFFTNAREFAEAIKESAEVKGTALCPSTAESSSASEEACKTTSTPE